ncbi:MAG: UbiD family decarboxylase [Dehalococcoidales bacterium]|jgi:4-hydroxy-3-polyprenylbenzoate decarboxylase|nr:UbiD family decarboxylase [Dehalococcoidales bacterium]
MAYYKDLREYIQALEDDGQLVRVKRRINKDTELMPLVRLQYRGLPEEQRRAFIFENLVDVKGREYHTPVAVSVLAGSGKIYSIGMMCEPEEIAEKLAQAALHTYEPKLVESAPVQEEVHMGDTLMEHGCLEEFPIPISTPGYDPSPAITAPFWVTKDPDSGIRNMATYRALIKSPTRTGLDFSRPTRGIAIHWNKCREKDIPLPAAIVIGGPPSIGYVSVSDYPIDTDELTVAGGIAGEPLEVVRCKTIDLEVPAHAEVVIEGEVNTHELEPEGAFGESIGIMSLAQPRPYFTVKAITHRRNPIWLAFLSQFPPSESTKIKHHGNSSAVYKHLRYDLGIEKVLKVNLHEMADSYLFLVVQVKNTSTEEVWRILEAAVKFKLSKRSKIIIAVDDDINPYDLEMVIFALGHRFQPHRDARIITQQAEGLMDCSLGPMEVLERLREEKNPQRPERSQLIIDATMNWPYPPISLPAKEFMERAQELWKEEGWPELKLREPVWGRNLGYWSREDEEKAERAIKGEHYKTGEIQAQRRIR